MENLQCSGCEPIGLVLGEAVLLAVLNECAGETETLVALGLII